MTRLSNRQYAMLRSFAEEAHDYYMKIEDAARFDQRPFRSMLLRGYITYIPALGFRITKVGGAAWREFLMTDIARKNPGLPLTSYFDPDAYGLKKPPARETGHTRAAVATGGSA